MKFSTGLLMNKILYLVIACFLISLPYSEAIKNATLIIMLFYFLFQCLSQNILIKKDLSNISIIAHLLFATIGIWVGVNHNESISQVGDVLKIVVAFLF